MEWEAQDEGFLAKILMPEGSKDVPVGTHVAVVVDDADSVSLPYCFDPYCFDPYCFDPYCFHLIKRSTLMSSSGLPCPLCFPL